MNADAAAVIIALSGPRITEAERALIETRPPAGLILFARNIVSRAQLRDLIAGFRALAGDDALVLIDQEGGRVARLRPPLAPELPPARRFGEIAESGDFVRAAAALELGVRLQAEALVELGIDVNCAPVLDLLIPGADPVIGDRAFSRDPEIVARLGRIAVEAMMASGILPVVKHAPGHGRAGVDTHLAPAVVEEDRSVLDSEDFVPFRALADAPAMMTAHVVYSALDPGRPASLSPAVVSDLIRGEFGFDGLVICDDLAMGALEGPLGARVEQAAAAGSDLMLVCSGRLADNEEALAAAPSVTDATRARMAAARARLKRGRLNEPGAAGERLARLLVGAPTREEEVGEGTA